MASTNDNYIDAYTKVQAAERHVNSLAEHFNNVREQLMIGKWQTVQVDGTTLRPQSATVGHRVVVGPITEETWPKLSKFVDGIKAFHEAKNEQKITWAALTQDQQRFFHDKKPL
jgi:hypothetical protein